MSDGQLFLLIFALIYVSDSGAWFGERSYLLFSFWTDQLSIRRHRFFFPGFKIGFTFLNPFPYPGQGYITSLFPFSISETGISPVCVENPNPGHEIFPDTDASFLEWDSIKSIKVDDKRLRGERPSLFEIQISASIDFLEGTTPPNCRRGKSRPKRDHQTHRREFFQSPASGTSPSDHPARHPETSHPRSLVARLNFPADPVYLLEIRRLPGAAREFVWRPGC